MGAMGQKAPRRHRTFWQEQAGTPWDLTLTCNSWFPGGTVLGRAAQPTAKPLIFIANKGQAEPRKGCRFLRHANSSALGGRSLRSPKGIAIRAPLFHIRQGHSLGTACGTLGRPLLPVQHGSVELKEVGRLQDGALGGKEGAGGRGKHVGWQLEERRDIISHPEHGSAFLRVSRSTWICPSLLPHRNEGLLWNEHSAALGGSGPAPFGKSVALILWERGKRICRVNSAFRGGKKRLQRRQLRLLHSFHVWLCSCHEAWGPAQHLMDAEAGTAPSPRLRLLREFVVLEDRGPSSGQRDRGRRGGSPGGAAPREG